MYCNQVNPFGAQVCGNCKASLVPVPPQKKNGTVIAFVIIVAVLFFIAVAGLLSTTVLVSLSSARSNARDSQLKNNLSQARTNFEIFSNKNSTYAGVCSDAATFANLPAFTRPDPVDYVCNDGPLDFVISAKLEAEDGYFCVDSAGFRSIIPNQITNELNCS